MTEPQKNWTRKRFVVSAIVRETEKALLVRIGEVDGWIAKKLCGSRLPEAAGDIIEIPAWLVEERGFKQPGKGGASKKDEGAARLEAYKAELRSFLDDRVASERQELEDAVERKGGATEIANLEGRYDSAVGILEWLFPSENEPEQTAEKAKESWNAETAKKTGTRCGICGLHQLESPGGTTCPNGHGGADPMSPEVEKLQAEQRKDAGLTDDDDDVPF